MQAVQTQFNIRAIQSSWSKFDSLVHLRPIHDATGYDEMTALMNSLLDVVGDIEDHALSGLLELVRFPERGAKQGPPWSGAPRPRSAGVVPYVTRIVQDAVRRLKWAASVGQDRNSPEAGWHLHAKDATCGFGRTLMAAWRLVPRTTLLRSSRIAS